MQGERLDLGEQLLHVLDRVALRQLVVLGQDGALLVHEHGFRRCGSAVDADDPADTRTGLNRRRLEPRDRIHTTELVQLSVARDERRSRGVPELRFAPAGDERLQRIETSIDADARRLVKAVHDRAERGVVLRIVWNDDQILDGHVGRIDKSTGAPRLRNPLPPARLQKRQERVGPAEQQHRVPERMAACENRQVLADDRVAKRAHDLARRDSRLHQVDDVGLGEDAALGGDVVQSRAVPFDPADLVARQPDLDQALVDRRASAGRALVVHRRDRAFLARRGLLVDDDLRVLSAELDDAARVRMQMIHRHRHRVHFLHELRAERLAQRAGAGAGDEDAQVRGTQRGERVADGDEQLQNFFGLPRFVTLIVGPENPAAVGMNDDCFHGRRSDVETDDEMIA